MLIPSFSKLEASVERRERKTKESEISIWQQVTYIEGISQASSLCRRRKVFCLRTYFAYERTLCKNVFCVRTYSSSRKRERCKGLTSDSPVINSKSRNTAFLIRSAHNRRLLWYWRSVLDVTQGTPICSLKPKRASEVAAADLLLMLKLGVRVNDRWRLKELDIKGKSLAGCTSKLARLDCSNE